MASHVLGILAAAGLMSAGASLPTETRSAQAMPVEKTAFTPAVAKAVPGNCVAAPKSLRQKLIAGKAPLRNCASNASVGSATYRMAPVAGGAGGGFLGTGVSTGLAVGGLVTAAVVTTVVVTTNNTP